MFYKIKLLLISLCLLSTNDAYKVLVVFPLVARSHAILGQGFVDTLSQAGHEVTYITQFPVAKPPPNVRQIDVSSVGDKRPADMTKITNMVKNPPNVLLAMFVAPMLSAGVLEHESVQALLTDTSEEFDVVIVEWFFMALLSGFAAVYKAPLIWSSSTSPHWQVLELIDEPSNPAYTSSVVSKVIPPFGFLDRVRELGMRVLVKISTIISEFTTVEPSFIKDFGPAFEKRGEAIPSYRDVAYSGSFMFFNEHPVLTTGYRLPQNAKYIGGYHIDPSPPPLSDNLNTIFDNAKHGVIYFSMGSNLKSKDMSENTKRGLLKMFGTLKETVLWKFEEELKGLPQNVHIVKWAPQLSILNHPKTKVFITHGGKLSTTETIHYGVPVIGIPIFGDQFVNMDQAVIKGYGIKVTYEEDLAKPLKAAIDDILSNHSYTDTAKRMSAILHDGIASPRQELLHWVEHVARTKGAPHLRSIALHVPWYQKMYLDLIAVLAVFLYIVRKLLCWACELRSSKKRVTDSKKRN